MGFVILMRDGCAAAADRGGFKVCLSLCSGSCNLEELGLWVGPWSTPSSVLLRGKRFFMGCVVTHLLGTSVKLGKTRRSNTFLSFSPSKCKICVTGRVAASNKAFGNGRRDFLVKSARRIVYVWTRQRPPKQLFIMELLRDVFGCGSRSIAL